MKTLTVLFAAVLGAALIQAAVIPTTTFELASGPDHYEVAANLDTLEAV